MTAHPQPPAARPPRHWNAGRVVALVLGILVLLPAAGLLASGGALLWVDRSHRTGGYLMSDPESLASSGFAVTSERISLSTGANWLPLSATLGTARVQVAQTDPGKAVFVGIAPVAAGTGYLGGVRRTVVQDIGGPFGGTGSRVSLPGGAPAGAPGDQTFWVVRASGAGARQLTWSPAAGDWMLVVMNADGSAGVSVQARIGATAPGLSGLSWGLIGGGVVLAVIGVLLVVLAVRRPVRRVGPPAAAGPLPSPTGPPPSWAPPAPRATPEPAAPDPTRAGPPAPGQPPTAGPPPA
jgi:hypothetical protein